MKKVLIIEDNPGLMEIYQEKFSSIYEVFITAHGDSGITKALEWKPDIIILDLVLLGKLNGLQVLNELKSHPQTQDIPVVVFTNLEYQCETALKGGAKLCLTKTSTEIKDLMAKIKEIVGE